MADKKKLWLSRERQGEYVLLRWDRAPEFNGSGYVDLCDGMTLLRTFCELDFEIITGIVLKPESSVPVRSINIEIGEPAAKVME